jgi:lipopolysaccharide/colanic/teichoic acid biosynthesis glycosyltransferase
MHCLVLLAIDLFIIFASTVFAIALSTGLHFSVATLSHVLPYCLLTLAIAVPVFLAAGLNRTLWRFMSLHDCLRIFITLTATILTATTAANAFSLMQGVPNSMPVLQFVLMSAALISVRAFSRIRGSRRNQRRNSKIEIREAREDILVIGISSVAELFLRCVTECGKTSIAVAGILSGTSRHRGRLLRSLPILGRPEELPDIMRELEIHGIHISRIAIGVPFHTLSTTVQETLLKIEHDLNVRIDLLHDRFGLCETVVSHSLATVAEPAAELGIVLPVSIAANRQMQHSYTRWKRLFDITATAVGAMCLAPLMVLVVAIVLLDVGYPFIFWQQRPGVRGKPIRVLKFRTMRTVRDAEGRLLSDAERLSAVGRFLRRTRVDELPQIINVLLGQMSIIGPRPLLPIDQSPRFVARLEMRPGLTGWAQVNGGRHLTIHDKAALDLWYVMNASFKIDVRILLLTARTIVSGEHVNHRAIREAWRALGCRPPTNSDFADPAEAMTAPRSSSWYQPPPIVSATPATESIQPR